MNSRTARTHYPDTIVGRAMRIFISIFVVLSLLLNSGCAIYEKETTNRGGYLDYVLDDTG